MVLTRTSSRSEIPSRRRIPKTPYRRENVARLAASAPSTSGLEAAERVTEEEAGNPKQRPDRNRNDRPKAGAVSRAQNPGVRRRGMEDQAGADRGQRQDLTRLAGG